MSSAKKLFLGLLLTTLTMGGIVTGLTLTSDLYKGQRIDNGGIRHHSPEQVLEGVKEIQSQLNRISEEFYTQKSYVIKAKLKEVLLDLIYISISKSGSKNRFLKEQYNLFKRLEVEFIKSLLSTQPLFDKLSDRQTDKEPFKKLLSDTRKLVSLINGRTLNSEVQKISDEQSQQRLRLPKDNIKHSKDNQKEEQKEEQKEVKVLTTEQEQRLTDVKTLQTKIVDAIKRIDTNYRISLWPFFEGLNFYKLNIDKIFTNEETKQKYALNEEYFIDVPKVEKFLAEAEEELKLSISEGNTPKFTGTQTPITKQGNLIERTDAEETRLIEWLHKNSDQVIRRFRTAQVINVKIKFNWSIKINSARIDSEYNVYKNKLNPLRDASKEERTKRLEALIKTTFVNGDWQIWVDDEFKPTTTKITRIFVARENMNKIDFDQGVVGDVKLKKYRKLFSDYFYTLNLRINVIKKHNLETELVGVLKSIDVKKELLQDILDNQLVDIAKYDNPPIGYEELHAFNTGVDWYLYSRIGDKN